MTELHSMMENDDYRRNVEKVQRYLAKRSWTYCRAIWSDCLGFRAREYDQSGGTLVSRLLTKECGWYRTNVRKRVGGRQEWIYCLRPKGEFDDILG